MNYCADCNAPLEYNPDMEEELKKNFPGVMPEYCEVICDECYARSMEIIATNVLFIKSTIGNN